MKNYFIVMGIFIGIIYSQCNNYSSWECNNDQHCEWVNDIIYGNCSSMSGMGECNATPGCNYSTLTYTCSGGTYILSDNSYCSEIEVLDCSEMNQSECNNDDSCNWVQDIEYGNCSNLGSSSCDANPNCWGAYTNPGWYYGWYCAGGTYQINNSYCEGVLFQQGDLNGDLAINVLDVIEIVNLILNGEWNFIADMNYDDTVNVLDVILVVDIIVGN